MISLFPHNGFQSTKELEFSKNVNNNFKKKRGCRILSHKVQHHETRKVLTAILDFFVVIFVPSFSRFFPKFSFFNHFSRDFGNFVQWIVGESLFPSYITQLIRQYIKDHAKLISCMYILQ